MLMSTSTSGSILYLLTCVPHHIYYGIHVVLQNNNNKILLQRCITAVRFPWNGKEALQIPIYSLAGKGYNLPRVVEVLEHLKVYI